MSKSLLSTLGRQMTLGFVEQTDGYMIYYPQN